MLRRTDNERGSRVSGQAYCTRVQQTQRPVVHRGRVGRLEEPHQHSPRTNHERHNDPRLRFLHYAIYEATAVQKVLIRNALVIGIVAPIQIGHSGEGIRMGRLVEHRSRQHGPAFVSPLVRAIRDSPCIGPNARNGIEGPVRTAWRERLVWIFPPRAGPDEHEPAVCRTPARTRPSSIDCLAVERDCRAKPAFGIRVMEIGVHACSPRLWRWRSGDSGPVLADGGQRPRLQCPAMSLTHFAHQGNALIRRHVRQANQSGMGRGLYVDERCELVSSVTRILSSAPARASISRSPGSSPMSRESTTS